MALTSSGCDFCSGWIAGMAGLIVGHPIDTLKVRQQIQGQRMLESLANIYRAGGMLTFFRGLQAPLLTTGCMNSIYFGFYGGSLDLLTEWRESQYKLRGNEPLVRQSRKRHKNVDNFVDYFIAGCVAGAAQLIVACPVDLVKVQLQSQIQKSTVRGPVDCAIRIVATGGIFGLYKGLTVQAWRDIPSSGIYFALYEFLKQQMSFGQEQSTKIVQFLSGGLAGIISWWSIIPLDVIKSRIQGDSTLNPKYKGIVHCGTVVFKAHGVNGLFRGFWPLSLRAFPVNGTTFLVYECLFHHCKQSQSSLYS